MGAQSRFWVLAVLCGFNAALSVQAAPLSNEISYQGQVKADGLPINDPVDLRFTLWDAATGGTSDPDVLTKSNLSVVNGLFTTALDFGPGAFEGSAKWLAIEIRHPAHTGTFIPMGERQPINAAPYALYALNAPGGGGGGTLDQAYDFGGAGAGRTITADSGAVAINGTGGLDVGPVELNVQGNDLDVQVERGPTINVNDPPNVTLGGVYRTGTIGSPVDHFAYLRVTSTDHRIIRDPGSDLRFATQSAINNSSLALAPVDQLTLTSGRRLGLGTSDPLLTFEAWDSSNLIAPQATTMGVRHSLTLLPGDPPSVSWLYLSAGSGGNRIVRDTGTTLLLGTEATFSNGTFTSQVEVASNGLLQVKGGSDVSLASGGQLIVGSTTGSNLGVDANEIMARNNGGPATLYINHENGTIALGAASPSGVGIGTATPKQKLHVNGSYYGLGHLYLYAFEGDGNSGTAYVQARDDSTTSSIDLRLRTKAGASLVDNITCKSNGRVGIGTTAPASLLDVAGTARVNVLTIDGGADLSENFDVLAGSRGATEPRSRDGDSNEATRQEGNTIEAGTVVSIDAENPGKLRVATSAYDTTVAGIVSGAGGVSTGMVMAHEGTLADGAHPVALSGRVYCKADASLGAIRPGDLLTTSDTPGHAMKVVDRDRANGAILGKAMTSLAAGEKGLVLVLVSLQ